MAVFTRMLILSMAFNGIKKKKISSPIKIPSPNSFSDLFGSRLVISGPRLCVVFLDPAVRHWLSKVGLEEGKWKGERPCQCEDGGGVGFESGCGTSL